jgi:hypothetical protein
MSLLTQIAPAEPSASPTEERDGQHDFDFNIGVWHSHIRRILDPLSGSTHSIDLDAQSEQAFSDDGGKTWEVNWINKFTRIKSPTS